MLIRGTSLGHDEFLRSKLGRLLLIAVVSGLALSGTGCMQSNSNIELINMNEDPVFNSSGAGYWDQSNWDNATWQ